MSIKTVAVAALTFGLSPSSSGTDLKDFSFSPNEPSHQGGQSQFIQTDISRGVRFTAPKLIPSKDIIDFTVSPNGTIITLESKTSPNKESTKEAPALIDQKVVGFDPKTNQSFVIFDTTEVRTKFPSTDPTSISVFGPLTFSKDGSQCAGRYRIRCHRPQGEVSDQYGYFVGTLTVPCRRFINTFSLDYIKNDGPPLEVYFDYRSKSSYTFVELSAVPAAIRAEFAKKSDHFFTFARSGGVDENGEHQGAEFGSSYVSDRRKLTVEAGGRLGVTITEEHIEKSTRVWISPNVEQLHMSFWEERYFPCTFAIIRPFGSFPNGPGILRAACREPGQRPVDLYPSVDRFFIGTLDKSHLRILFLSQQKAYFIDAEHQDL